MPKLDASSVAALLTELGQRTRLAGGNPYRAKAYLKAADSLAAIPVPLSDLVAADRLRQIPGVGETIAEIIERLHLTGAHPALERMRQDIPAGVLEMLTVPGLRPEKALKLYRELGIGSLDELESAIKAERIKSIKGLGHTFQTKIMEELEIRRSTQGARHIHRAAALLDAAQKNLAQSDMGLIHITPAGDYRRGCELVSDLALVAEMSSSEKPQGFVTGALKVNITKKREFGIALLFATGSVEHLEELRRLANSKGLELTSQGLCRGGKVIASQTETGIYEALGLPFIPPELREGRGEIALAQRKRLPKLVKEQDIQGILHAHTQASDGVNTLEQMAEATRERGYTYFGVADHSQSAGYAGGLSVEEIDEQHKEIDRLNAAYGAAFHIFKGIESDILLDGSLDYSDDILERFDFVVASVHSRFKLDRASQTDRIIRAVKNPHTTILGHMTGRQLLRRPGYDIDVEGILAVCAERGVVVEINANPWRLDLDWRWHSRALELGCMFSINPDAHSTSEVDLTRWGVIIARKGGVPKNRVLNCLSLQQLTTFLAAPLGRRRL